MLRMTLLSAALLPVDFIAIGIKYMINDHHYSLVHMSNANAYSNANACASDVHTCNANKIRYKCTFEVIYLVIQFA
jgi:hypothetical protein